MSDIPEYRTGELPDVDPTIGLLSDTSKESIPKPEDGDQPPLADPPTALPIEPTTDVDSVVVFALGDFEEDDDGC